MRTIPVCAGCHQTNVEASESQIAKQRHPPFKAYCVACVTEWQNANTKAPPRDPTRSNFLLMEVVTNTWEIRAPFNQPCFEFADKGSCSRGAHCYKQHGHFDPRCYAPGNYAQVFLTVRHARQHVWYI